MSQSFETQLLKDAHYMACEIPERVQRQGIKMYQIASCLKCSEKTAYNKMSKPNKLTTYEVLTIYRLLNNEKTDI